MKIQPRQHLLDIWRAAADTSWKNGKWVPGGRAGSNSISDAEQLLCVLFPAVEVAGFQLHDPNDIADDALSALAVMGVATDLPMKLIQAVRDYFERYRDESGNPTFAGGDYFTTQDPDLSPTAEQRSLDVVDSFSMSISLCLATLGFVKQFTPNAKRKAQLAELDKVQALASERLTAAMVGLLRSYSVLTYGPDSAEGQELLRRVDQVGIAQRAMVDRLRLELAEVRSGLQRFSYGIRLPEDMDDESKLFECGWSWGVVDGAPLVENTSVTRQPDGIASNAPYLYSTVVALDGISDLFSERTRRLNLLNAEQLQLMNSVQVRWENTRLYWQSLAMLGPGRWPIEDVPWRTTDGDESDYYTVLVASIAVPHLERYRSPDPDVERLIRVLQLCAERGKITSRPVGGDQAVALHSPGVPIALAGSDKLGPPLRWTQSDYAAVLLKRTVGVLSLASNTALQTLVGDLADDVWEHLKSRQISTGLWDQPAGIFDEIQIEHKLPSWYFTERVVESLVQTSLLLTRAPLTSSRMISDAAERLGEADWLYNQQMLRGASGSLLSELRQVERTLRRARGMMQTRPATASALAESALRDLNTIDAAQQDRLE
jgi:hypothetical protein